MGFAMSSEHNLTSWYNPPTRILVVDDDQDLLNLISFTFHNAGYETVNAASGSEALRAMEQERFSLLVLDINIPAPNGLQVCATVRRNSTVPVLMLTARDQEQDLLQALDAGADAYIVKPFSPRTLIARVQALLRRGAPNETLNAPSDRFKLDSAELLLKHPDGEIQLTRLETRVLRLLMLNTGHFVNAGDLVSEVWNTYNAANRNMLKQVVFRLRRKLEGVPEAFQALKTMPGGYVWSESAAEERIHAHR
jgi:DNA-binding response OmpR family regulator